MRDRDHLNVSHMLQMEVERRGGGGLGPWGLIIKYGKISDVIYGDCDVPLTKEYTAGFITL